MLSNSKPSWPSHLLSISSLLAVSFNSSSLPHTLIEVHLCSSWDLEISASYSHFFWFWRRLAGWTFLLAQEIICVTIFSFAYTWVIPFSQIWGRTIRSGMRIWWAEGEILYGVPQFAGRIIQEKIRPAKVVVTSCRDSDSCVICLFLLMKIRQTSSVHKPGPLLANLAADFGFH